MQHNRSQPLAPHPWWLALRDFFYGVTRHEFVHHARSLKEDAEALFLLVTIGDVVGLPVMPPACALRLLPYALPRIASWKRRLSRPKEFWEKEELDLHGI
jgi:hypothetical protein